MKLFFIIFSAIAWAGVVLGLFFLTVERRELKNLQLTHDTQIKINRSDIDLMMLRAAVDRYHARNGKYPTNAEGLDVLLGDGYGIEARNLTDPWGHPYCYREPEGKQSSSEIFSNGPDLDFCRF